MDLDGSGFIRVAVWKMRPPKSFNFVELSEAIVGITVEMR
jgi:hypothetical protein